MPTGDFDVDRLARYLHLTPQQVQKMADRGRLPGRRVGDQWRFSGAEIHHWLEDRIGASGDDDQLVRVENVLQRADDRGEDVCLADILAPQAVAVPLAARTRSSVISAMVDLAAQTGWLWDPEKMVAAVKARETLHSTAMENGVALLHPRRPQPNLLAQPMLALGRSLRGLPFGDARGRLTDIFFLILSIDDRGHLRTLARLSRLIGAPGVLEAMRSVEDPQGLFTVIKQQEQELFQ